LGGSIAPGLQMRLNALNTFTARLPLVSLEGDHLLIGNTTETSIRSGVLSGSLAEIRGMINQYGEAYQDLIVLLTGGDTNYFERNLKSNIFAVPNLVLYGLRDILKHNVDL
jgi:type III pantothenate kinase